MCVVCIEWRVYFYYFCSPCTCMLLEPTKSLTLELAACTNQRRHTNFYCIPFTHRLTNGPRCAEVRLLPRSSLRLLLLASSNSHQTTQKHMQNGAHGNCFRFARQQSRSISSGTFSLCTCPTQLGLTFAKSLLLREIYQRTWPCPCRSSFRRFSHRTYVGIACAFARSLARM